MVAGDGNGLFEFSQLFWRIISVREREREREREERIEGGLYSTFFCCMFQIYHNDARGKLMK
jgi:hypothetical protein